MREQGNNRAVTGGNHGHRMVRQCREKHIETHEMATSMSEANEMLKMYPGTLNGRAGKSRSGSIHYLSEFMQ